MGSPWVAADIELVRRLPLEVVVVPKAESVRDIERLAGTLDESGSPADIVLVLETARGVLRAEELAEAPHVAAVAFGAEDYAASVGARRTREAHEVLYARSRVVAAAAAAGVEAIDQVFLSLDDEVGLEAEMRFAAQLGYRGKMVIHPKQVAPVHRALRPTAEEVKWAREIVAAAAKAAAAHEGVAAPNRTMVDAPVVAQAQRILSLASDGDAPRV